MTECNAIRIEHETLRTLLVLEQHRSERSYPAYIGLDVHKETIAWAIAREGRSEPEYRGEVANRPKTVEKLVARLNKEFGGEVLLWCYEAGPCGYVLHRQLLELGHDCQVVAPSKIPKQSGERIKTDRRDAIKLSQLLRGGNLSGVWVPDAEQEAMRDLTRARGDMKIQERKAQQQLNAFALRNGHSWPAKKKRWTSVHYNWLEALRFDHDWQQVVLQEYVSQGAANGALCRSNKLLGMVEQSASSHVLITGLCTVAERQGSRPGRYHAGQSSSVDLAPASDKHRCGSTPKHASNRIQTQQCNTGEIKLPTRTATARGDVE